jgi:putative flippase GtrA
MVKSLEKNQHFLIKILYVQKILKICKYCISGGTGAITDFGLFSVLISFFSMNYLMSNFISFSCGTLVTYFLQKNWTFQHKSSNHVIVFPRFVLAVIGTYILNNVLLFTFVDIFTFDVFVAKILQIVISTIWGYSINSFFVFKYKKETDCGKKR